MKQRSYILLLFSILLSANGYAQKGIMRLTAPYHIEDAVTVYRRVSRGS